jgi:PAS domain S-box-containing protein
MLVKIENYWNSILSIGDLDTLNYRERIRLRTLNGFSFISFLFVAAFILAFVAAGSYSALQALPIALVMLLVQWFNARHRFETAKVFMIFFLTLVVLLMALADRRTGTEYVLIAVACSSILILDDLLKISLGFTLALLCFGFYTWYDAYYLFVPDPTVPYTYMKGVVAFVSISAVIAQLLVFRSLINRYAHDLKVANTKVVATNEELKAANQELQSLTGQLDWIVQQKGKELQTYLDAINVHVYSAVTDTHGTLLKVNGPLASVTGFTQEELIGKNFSLLTADQAPHSINDLLAALSKGKTWRGELKNRRKDGSIFWIDMVVIPLENDKGMVNYFLTLALPITERKEAEEQREKTVKMLEGIAFRASHKVRGPIARIQGLMYLMNNDYIEKEEMELITNSLKTSIYEMDLATSELTSFVNTHYEERAQEETRTNLDNKKSRIL